MDWNALFLIVLFLLDAHCVCGICLQKKTQSTYFCWESCKFSEIHANYTQFWFESSLCLTKLVNARCMCSDKHPFYLWMSVWLTVCMYVRQWKRFIKCWKSSPMIYISLDGELNSALNDIYKSHVTIFNTLRRNKMRTMPAKKPATEKECLKRMHDTASEWNSVWYLFANAKLINSFCVLCKKIIYY